MSELLKRSVGYIANPKWRYGRVQSMIAFDNQALGTPRFTEALVWCSTLWKVRAALNPESFTAFSSSIPCFSVEPKVTSATRASAIRNFRTENQRAAMIRRAEPIALTRIRKSMRTKAVFKKKSGPTSRIRAKAARSGARIKMSPQLETIADSKIFHRKIA